MLEQANPDSFEEGEISNQIEIALREEKNSLIEGDDHCSNNRLLYLIGLRRFHTEQSQKAYQNLIDQPEDPGLFLKKLLGSICHLKAMVFGHVEDTGPLISFTGKVADSIIPNEGFLPQAEAFVK